MNWRIKGVIQKVLSVVPGGSWANDQLSRTVGGLRDFERNVDLKVVGDWLVFAAHMRELGVRLQNLDYLEVGTGWYPTLPVCFSLAGARSCRTFDIEAKMHSGLTFRMLARLERHLPEIASASGRSIEDVRVDYERLRASTSVEELLRRARVEYLAPTDASRSGLPAASVDVVFSNSVLEHVPRDHIAELLKESHRVLRPGGLSIHSANCGDHYAYFDRSITPINYLTYTDRKWRFWDNRLLYQNRLRPGDFIALAEESGLKVVLSRFKPRAELMAILPRMRIAPEFQKYSPEQLCSTSVDFAGRR